MARESVVRFVQEYNAHAMNRQKRNAEKNERANVHLFIEGDLFLLSSVNLPRHVVTNVGGRKLLPKNIGPLVCCADKATHTQSSYHVRCVRILRLCGAPPVLPVRVLFRR